MLGHAGDDQGPGYPDDACACRRVGDDDTQCAGGDGRAHDGNYPGQDAQARERPEPQARERPGYRPRPSMRVAGIGRGVVRSSPSACRMATPIWS